MMALNQAGLQRIALATSGGDCAGLNAVIAGAVRMAASRSAEVYGLGYGFAALLANRPPRRLSLEDVLDIEREGGTILGSDSRGAPFQGGSPEAVPAVLAAAGIDALIMAGGDGTMSIAAELDRVGIPVVGVPKTIDRDVPGTDTFGFDTAVGVATDAIDRLHTTARSHRRIMVVEVMGRDAGWIALHAGLASGAAAILLPEIPYDLALVAAHIEARRSRGRSYHIVVVSEGARGRDEAAAQSLRTGRYAGVGERLASQLEAATGIESRSVALGHLLRGGAPSAADRILGLRFGAAAVDALLSGVSGVMLTSEGGVLASVPLEVVAGRAQGVMPGEALLTLARSLGICLGA